MSDIAIRIENIGKRYRYGGVAPLTSSLRADLTDWVKGWFRRNKQPHATLQQIHEQRIAQSSEYFWALRDINLEVQRGEVLGIIGRNGAGKSTLLKILSRITQPTTGKVTYYGRMASLLEVGTGFHRELTGRENIFLNGSILGMRRSEIAKKLDEIVAFAEVEKFLDTPVKFYSSGMYVRLAFAVAAHLEPEILLVDEVLAVGDVAFQKKCLGKMGHVAEQGRTVLFVSHNMSAIAKLCSRAMLLKEGRAMAIGLPTQVINTYLSNYQQSRALVDLSGFKSEYGQGEISVLSLELLNGTGDGFSLPWDQPIRLRLRVRANRDLKSVSFAIGCVTMDHVGLFTVRSSDHDYPNLSLQAGEECTVGVTIRHPLRAGLFHIGIGISSGNYAYYYNPTAAQLELLDVGETPYMDKNYGLIRCDANWSIT